MYALDKDGNIGGLIYAGNDGSAQVISGKGGYSALKSNAGGFVQASVDGSISLSPIQGKDVIINNNGKLCFSDNTSTTCLTKAQIDAALKLIPK